MTQAKPQLKTRDIEARTEIAAPIEAVWKALTDPEELTRWFPLEAGANPDGTTWMAWGKDFRFEGKVDIFEPPHRLRSIPLPPRQPGDKPAIPAAKEQAADAPPVMATDCFLETRGGKTVVRLVHSGFSADAAWDEEFDGTARGWQFQLAGLRHYLENHHGTPRRVAWARKFLQISRDAAWQRLMSPEGVLAEGSLEGLKPGAAYSFRAATGDTFQGTVHVLLPPRDFSGTVKNLNNAYMRLQLDDLPMRKYRDVNLWVSTYGVPQGEVDALRDRFQALFERLFG